MGVKSRLVRYRTAGQEKEEVRCSEVLIRKDVSKRSSSRVSVVEKVTMQRGAATLGTF